MAIEEVGPGGVTRRGGVVTPDAVNEADGGHAYFGTDASGNTVLVGAGGIGFTSLIAGFTDLRVNAIQAIAPNTTSNVTWHAAVEDNLGAWSAGDPTKIIVPAGVNAMRVHGHLEWTISQAPGTAVITAQVPPAYLSARVYVNDAAPTYPYNSAADVRAQVGTISDHQGITLPFSRCTPGNALSLSVRHNDITTPTINILNTSAVRLMVEWLITN